MSVETKVPRSAFDKAGGLVYFPRLLDKIRLFAKGELRVDFHANLGKGADGWCCSFLRVQYADLKERTLAGGNDDEILEWCYANGRRLNDVDVWVWNQCMTRTGWRDNVSRRLEEYKTGSGLSHRDDLVTVMDFMEVDEGRRP